MVILSNNYGGSLCDGTVGTVWWGMREEGGVRKKRQKKGDEVGVPIKLLPGRRGRLERKPRSWGTLCFISSPRKGDCTTFWNGAPPKNDLGKKNRGSQRTRTRHEPTAKLTRVKRRLRPYRIVGVAPSAAWEAGIQRERQERQNPLPRAERFVGGSHSAE